MEAALRPLLAVVCLLAVGHAAAAELVLPPEQVQAGRTLYLETCADCHGQDAAGDSAPDIQGSIPPDVQEAIKGFEAMPVVELQDGEAESIAVFLMSLAPDQARRRLKLD